VLQIALAGVSVIALFVGVLATSRHAAVTEALRIDRSGGGGSSR